VSHLRMVLLPAFAVLFKYGKVCSAAAKCALHGSLHRLGRARAANETSCFAAYDVYSIDPTLCIYKV